MSPAEALSFLAPYEPSPTVWVFCGATVALYLVGSWKQRRRLRHRGRVRALAFLSGMMLLYLALQTRFDYYAQHLFFLHRLQHLILHHIAPFLIAWSAPQAVIALALPRLESSRAWLGRRILSSVYAALQQPFIAASLFVGLIWVWLIPDLHLAAMLSLPLYRLMNWGMALDGVLFWWMILNMPARGDDSSGTHLGVRLLVLGLTMPPQILIGSAIALSHQDLYPIYSLCGRVLGVDAMTDQQLGGLLTWIPAAMMSVLGALVLTSRWLHQESMRTEDWLPTDSLGRCRS